MFSVNVKGSIIEILLTIEIKMVKSQMTDTSKLNETLDTLPRKRLHRLQALKRNLRQPAKNRVKRGKYIKGRKILTGYQRGKDRIRGVIKVDFYG